MGVTERPRALECTHPHLLPHESLLAICASSYPEEDVHRAVHSLLSRRELDWNEFIKQSVRHGIAPQVAVRLRSFAHDDRLPVYVSDCFARMHRGNVRRNEVIFRETTRLFQGLQAAGIRALVLKGVALSLTIYEEPGQRNFADVDILVDAENFAAAGQVALACGFEMEDGHPHPRQIHVLYMARCSEDILTETLPLEFDPTITPEMLAPQADLIKVEVHQNLFRRTNKFFMREVDVEPFWERARTVSLPDETPVLVPSPEAMAVHLCEHAASHNFSRLLFPLDLARLIETEKARIDWERVATIARQSGTTEEVSRMLSLIQRDFGACLPDFVLPELESDRSEEPTAGPLTVAQLFQTSQLDAREQIWERMSAVKGKRAFLGACWEMLFPPLHYMEAGYGIRPPLVIAFLYCWRPFRLAAGLGWVMYRKIRARKRFSASK